MEEIKEPKPEGRPSKYKPIFCEWIIEHMSRGNSFETFPAFAAKRIPREEWFSRSSCYQWVDDHKEFSDAKNIAFDMRLLEIENLELGIAKGERAGNIVATIHLIKSIAYDLYGEKQATNSHIHINAGNEVDTTKLPVEVQTALARAICKDNSSDED